MKKVLAALAACIGLLATGTAQAVTIQTSDTSHPWQGWADQAQVPTYAGTLPLTVAPDYFACGGFTEAEGCTSITPAVDQTTGAILQGDATVATEIDGNDDPQTVRGTLYHELGQVFWAEYMTPADEDAFMRIVGLDGDHTAWGNWKYTTTTNGVTITFPPFEWFVEGYRYCAEWGVNQPVGVNDYEGLGYPGDRPTFAAQQRQVCQLIDRVGSDNGIATPAQTAHGPTHLTGRVIEARIRTGRLRHNRTARLTRLR